MIDSQFLENFQDQDSYSSFQVLPHQNKEQIDLEKSVEAMIQSQIDFTQSINKLKAQTSQLVNTRNDRNEKTLPNQLLTIMIFVTLLI